jgi:putative lipoic acid-binding regulatory protein
MFSLPTLELLESTHEFPGRFTFKAIGRDDGHFMGHVVAAVRIELPDDNEPPFSFRKTAHGRHIAVTIEPDVESAAHVLQIYERLQEVEGLVMLL